MSSQRCILYLIFYTCNLVIMCCNTLFVLGITAVMTKAISHNVCTCVCMQNIYHLLMLLFEFQNFRLCNFLQLRISWELLLVILNHITIRKNTPRHVEIFTYIGDLSSFNIMTATTGCCSAS